MDRGGLHPQTKDQLRIFRNKNTELTRGREKKKTIDAVLVAAHVRGERTRARGLGMCVGAVWRGRGRLILSTYLQPHPESYSDAWLPTMGSEKSKPSRIRLPRQQNAGEVCRGWPN